ncbi:rhomboid family intramembrane serine protease, partial [Ralstonia edaphi]|uniref:rhomboid family intramembrane serine protease n=1 Tax=Ralstonia edaphi TaxID=3058599 RepID=UPI00292DA010
MSDSPEDRQQPHTATTMEALPSIDRHVRSEEQTPAARATPKFSVTTLLIGITAFVFLLSIVFGEGFVTFSPSALYRLGGNLAALSLTGDTWRLLTNVFLHAGIVHLLLNMYMLFLVGRLAERWFGQAGTLAIYLLGGLWASYASACWLGWQLVSQADASMTVSVGASGAIMALCGSLIVMAWLHDDTPPLLAKEGATLSGTGKVLMQTVAINIVMGFAINGVDQAAHLGGLLAGAIFGLAVGAATDVARMGWSPHRRIVLTAVTAVGVLYGCLSLATWPALREWRISWNQEAAEQDAVEQRAEEERRAPPEPPRPAPASPPLPSKNTPS